MCASLRGLRSVDLLNEAEVGACTLSGMLLLSRRAALSGDRLHIASDCKAATFSRARRMHSWPRCAMHLLAHCLSQPPATSMQPAGRSLRSACPKSTIVPTNARALPQIDIYLLSVLRFIVWGVIQDVRKNIKFLIQTPILRCSIEFSDHFPVPSWWNCRLKRCVVKMASAWRKIFTWSGKYSFQ